MRVMKKAQKNRAEASSDCIMSRSDIQPRNGTILVNTISPAIDLSKMRMETQRMYCREQIMSKGTNILNRNQLMESSS